MSKHILIVSQYFYPEHFRINDIASEWVKQGHKVTVITGIPNYPQGKFYKGYGWTKKRREVWNGIDIIRIPIFARGKTSFGMSLNYFSFVFSGFFWKCFTKINADLVFTFEVSPMTQALVGVWFAKRRKIPHYIYVQDLWPENVEIVTGIHSKLVIKPISKMVNYIYKNSYKILATSPSFVRSIQKRVPNEKSKVIYWPQYAEEFYKPVSERSERIPQDGILNITFTGNIGTAQGLEILPESAKLLKEAGIKVRFNIVGDGRSKADLLSDIRVCGVEEYFNMVGRVSPEEVPSILSASDAAFLSFENNPLYSKTIPAKLQSYMACACPIIASAFGETSRIIRRAKCGIVTEIGDPHSLVEGIIRFSELSENERKEMANSAADYCSKFFNKEVLMKTLNNEYLNI